MRDVDVDRDPPPAWNWSDEQEPPRRGRRWMLLSLAAVPWLVVAVVVLRPAPPVPAPEPPAVAAGEVGPTAPASPPDAPAAPSEPAPVTPDPEATLVSSAARHTPDVGDAVTVAVLVARAWFVGPGPQAVPVDPALAGGQPGYVEHLWVEAVDAPWRGQVVVVLGALVLERTGDALTPRARRLAVPVQLDAAGASAAGAPYLLPDPELRFEPLAVEPVEDPDAAVAAAQALSEAGYAVDEVLGLARAVDSWPWSVTFQPTGEGAAPATVWLRPHLGGFVVAGWLPSREPPPEHAPQPEPDATPEPAPDPTADDEEVAP